MEPEHRFDDARLEAMLGKLLFQASKDLVCPSGKAIKMICTNPKCSHPSLFCNNEDCIHCKEDYHEDCSLTPIKGVISRLNSNT